FGVIKRRFRLLTAAAEYDLRTQAKIPCALAALHNYIRIHDPDDATGGDSDAEESNNLDIPNIAHYEADVDVSDDLGAHISTAEKERAAARRDNIAMAMWDDYQRELEARGEL
ncbi:hypothetical protein BD779DRAFT_1453842, partial [Infundibulicybe gibba]